MITHIELDNFQSHERTELALAPGVNVLVGPSDSGKSAIVRGINWWRSNRPGGDEFIRHGERSASVAVELGDGSRIVRRKTRSSSDNSYEASPSGGPPVRFEALGQGVPSEVAEAIGMSDINFQLQADPVFLLSGTGGEISRELNAAASLDGMDAALSNIAAMLRDARSDEATSKERLAAATAAKLRYEGMPELDEAFADAAQRASAHEAIVQDIRALGAALAHSSEIGCASRSASAVLEVPVEGLHERCKAASEAERELRSLRSLIEELRHVESEAKCAAAASRISIGRSAEIYEELSEVERRRSALASLAAQAAEAADALSGQSEALRTLEMELKEAMPETCPLCKRPMNP